MDATTPQPDGPPMPESGTRPLVIMPCYNEAGRVGTVVRGVRDALPSAVIAVVDDASSDDSAIEAANAGAVVLRHGCNLGYGAALETGYTYAVRHGHAPVLQLDADGQHLPDQLGALCAAMDGGAIDMAIGSRYGPQAAAGTPLLRRTGHRVFAVMIRLLTGLRLTDPTSGFQALSRRAVGLFASGVFPCDYPDSDVIVMAHLAGLNIREVPVTMVARAGGKSMHAGLKPFYYGIKMLLSMFIVLLNVFQWRQWRRRLQRGEVP